LTTGRTAKNSVWFTFLVRFPAAFYEKAYLGSLQSKSQFGAAFRKRIERDQWRAAPRA